MSTIRKEENISKVETIDCKSTNKFVSSPISFEGPLNWREIVCTQPEKEEILRNWFNETGCWPKANSTPVFDVTDQIVYPGYSLDYPNVDKRGEAVGTAAFIKIRKAVLEKNPVDWDKYKVNNFFFHKEKLIEYSGFYLAAERFNGHIFVGCSDVDQMILVSALQNYKTAKEVSKVKEEKNKALDEVLTKLKALEKEIEEIQKK